MPQSPISDGACTFMVDFDSTCSSSEMLVEMMRYALQERRPEEAQSITAEITRITDESMAGRITPEEAMRLRLAMVTLTRAHMEQYAREAVGHVTEGLREVFDDLRNRGHEIRILSGGFAKCIEPAARTLGVAMTHVHANALIFDNHGKAIGVKDKRVLQMDGKAHSIRDLRARGCITTPHVCMVGDGMTDVMAVADGAADLCIAFGIHVVRKEVFAKARYGCRTIAEFRTLTRALF